MLTLPRPPKLLSSGLIVAFLVALLMPFASASAQTFPALSGRVVDQADLLDPAQESVLTSKLEQLETASGRQLVVATIADLEGYDIETYGYQLGREWGLGDAERNDGALLLVAPNDRKVRVEVGYGLEGIITDALSALIIQNDILPRFRSGDMAGGIVAGVDQLSLQLALPEEEARARAAAPIVVQNQRGNDNDGEAGLVIFWLVVLGIIIVMSMSRGKGGKRYRGGAGPVIIWGGGSSGFGGGGSSWGGGGGGFGGGFSGGGGSFGGGGASGGW